MKKLIFSATLVSALMLGACGDEEKNTAKNNQTSSEETSEKNESTESTEKATNEPEVEESELGKKTVVFKNKELNMTQTTGPMTLTINAAQVATLEPTEEYKEMFGGQDIATVVTVTMVAENSSEDTISWYPDQATLVTDTGQQVDADLLFSGQVGGDFLGKVKKEDNVIWILKHDETIKNLKLHISAPHDENLNSIGEDLIFEIPVQ